jgi:CRP/FNR family transcriptional regulator
VSRAFSRFQDDRLLEVRQRHIEILDAPALQALVNGSAC